MISEDPVNDARIGITATVSLLGLPPVTFEGDLSELDAWLNDIPGIGPILNAIGDTTQFVLDTAVTTLEYDPAGTLVICFTRGTLIETEDGVRLIEDLRVGDRVMTRDNGIKEIRWIGTRKLCAKAIAANPGLRPIRIRAGALGSNTPSTDLLVSPQHRVLVRSQIAQRMFGTLEVLVPAKQLCQLDGIDIAEDLAEVEYFHFLFDQHEVVYANGAASESLYTGPQALKSVGLAAREEIFTLFPELRDAEFASNSARELPSGRKSRKLAMRHRLNGKPLVMDRMELSGAE
ncbi:hemolysin [Paracoccus methylarcula]|uniref:Hemolysin n=2 Tax=Paracoccus methylarcula TaxID=72022 RepID=A0A422QZI2_9RHOB|nr:hemolysin [Paracoccus methylarcula]